MLFHAWAKKCGPGRAEPTGAAVRSYVVCCAQPFIGTETGSESLKVSFDLAERVELSFFCLAFSLLWSLDLAEALLALSAGRSELVFRSEDFPCTTTEANATFSSCFFMAT